MALNIVNESALTVLETLTDLPRLKEALRGFVASFYEHYFKDRDKNILQRAPERKETGDSETSLEGRGPSEDLADATRAEELEERRQRAEEDRKRKAEEKERKAAEKEGNR